MYVYDAGSLNPTPRPKELRLYKTLDGQALDASKSSYKLVLSKKARGLRA